MVGSDRSAWAIKSRDAAKRALQGGWKLDATDPGELDNSVHCADINWAEADSHVSTAPTTEEQDVWVEARDTWAEVKTLAQKRARSFRKEDDKDADVSYEEPFPDNRDWGCP